MLKKYFLIVLIGLFLMAGCQKEAIMPVNNGFSGSTLRNGDADPNDEDGGITDPNNEDEEEEFLKISKKNLRLLI
jgi:hypothetical protein